jgi:enoyl-CoA hydratase/carnithine racemase
VIQATTTDGVAFLRLDRGVTNPIDLELVNRLGEALTSAEDDADVAAVVLGSTNEKFFSIGFDIPALFAAPPPTFLHFFQAFDQLCLRLLGFPKPLVAALRGHATAGGCILAVCCDYRLIADGRRLMGLNEIKLGVPLPWPAECALRRLVGPRIARDVIDSGEFLPPDQLLRLGLVDAVLPVAEVEEQAARKARSLASTAGPAYRYIKRDRIEGLEAEIRDRLEDKERIFLDCWYSEPARRRLTEALERFKK